MNPFQSARHQAGLSQVAAAQRIGTHKDLISRIERGKAPAGRRMLTRMADVYGCSVDQLLGRQTIPEPTAGGAA